MNGVVVEWGGGWDNPAVDTCVGGWDGDHLIMWVGSYMGLDHTWGWIGIILLETRQFYSVLYIVYTYIQVHTGTYIHTYIHTYIIHI